MYPRAFPYHEAANYPFSEMSSFQLTDTIYFPADFIADAHIYVTGQNRYEITRLVKRRGQITIYIGTIVTQELIEGHYRIEAENINEFTKKTIELIDTWGRRAGLLVVKSLESILFVPDGDYSLLRGTAMFEVACHVPIVEDRLVGFIVDGQLVTGDVEFVGTQGITLERKDNAVFFHFTGEPYYAIWRQEVFEEEFFNRYVASIDLTVINNRDPANLISKSFTLLPDINGNIPIYTNSLVLYGDALRLTGRRNSLDIRLAARGN